MSLVYETTFGAPVRARVVTTSDEYPVCPESDAFRLHDARADLESLRGSDPAHHARAELLLRGAPKGHSARAEAYRIRAAIAYATPTDETPREASVPSCGSCGRSFDCTCGT